MERLEDALELVNASEYSYCKYISPNDLGITGGHQCGYYFPHTMEPMFYGAYQSKGTNNEVTIKIRWQKDFETTSRAKYYGSGTRNENRITCFGRGFEFMQDIYLGSLLIVSKGTDGNYDAYVLSNQDNIESFLLSFNLDLTKRIQLIKSPENEIHPDEKIEQGMSELIARLDDFPHTREMALLTQDLVNRAYDYSERKVSEDCDKILPKWIDVEYRIFSNLEEKLYREIYSTPFDNCQQLIDVSNTILNRRKSRAGKSLEHHLARVFTCAKLRFEEQVVTEENKKPDFIFPDAESYHNFEFPADKLVCLGAKTTCKDRWRQVLNEADRVEGKHLFTLQQGVSTNQLREMQAEHLTLVIPHDNLSMFHPDYRENIMDLATFISMVREKQA